MEQKNYYAIIPANVRYDTELNANAKLLYGEITALCNEKGFCWAKNEYFSNLYNVSTTSISKWISRLKKNGYIFIQIHYKENSKEILNRFISLTEKPIEEILNTYLTKVKGGIEEKLNRPIEEKLKDNNITSFNNTNNNERKKGAANFEIILNESGCVGELKSTFYEFIKMRERIKKPLTDYALKLRIKDVQKISNGNVDLAIEILNQSITACWQDVFPLKNKQPQNNVNKQIQSKNNYAGVR